MSRYGARQKKVEFTISEESAMAQVNELLEYYDIDVEGITAGDSKEAKAAADGLEKSLDHVCRAFRSGILTIEYDKDNIIEVHHKIKGADPLVYSEVRAKAKKAMEKVPTGASYTRIYAFMGSLSGIGTAGIEKLAPIDLAIVETLGTVFSNA